MVERTAKLIENSGGLRGRRSLQWRQLALSLVLILLGAVCLLKYLGWAWMFSGNYGLPSHAKTVLAARQWSLTYFGAGLLVEAALIANLTISLRFDNTELTGLLKILVRVLSAVGLAVIGTLGTAFLLSCVGRMLG